MNGRDAFIKGIEYSQNICKMKANKTGKAGSGIAIGSAIGVLLGCVLGKNSNTSQSIALGLAFGVAVGSVIDFVNRYIIKRLLVYRQRFS